MANPLSWLLLSLPVYLFARGRFVDYLSLAK